MGLSLTPVQLKKAEEYLKNENIMELFNIQIKKDISNFMSSLIYEITPEKFDRDYKVWASKAVVFDLFDIVQKRILGNR